MKRILHAAAFFCPLLMSLATPTQNPATPGARPNSTFCIECLRIRVGPPTVVRGPAPDIEDFTEIRLPGGRFRGFVAGAKTYAIDGDSPWDMGGPARVVLDRGAPGSYDDSGQWIHHVEQHGSTILGCVHNESGDRPGQGLQSMSLSISTDYGLTWKSYGQIITGKDAVLTPHKVTGTANCTAIDGQDGYYYAYCWQNGTGHGDGAEIIARAPVADPLPRNWKKYYEGRWDQPGVGGDATGLPKGVGGSVARWSPSGQIMLLGRSHDGLVLSFSTDELNFTEMPEPLLDVGGGSWHPRNALEIISYPVLYDPNDGSNQLSSNSWMLFYMYVEPHEGMGRRYLVYRPVEVSQSRRPGEPAVGVLLARWYNATLRDRWSTTAAVPAVDGSEYKLEARSGYLMTAADPKQPSVEVEDCLSPPGQPLDHVLMLKTARGHVCEDHGYERSRTAGFVYSSPQPKAQPLYSCKSDSGTSHFASNTENCDHLGKMGTLLGYDLRD